MLGLINIPNVLKQCMNGIIPQTASKHKLSPVKTSPINVNVKKSRTSFSPIIIPGTPEATIPDLQEEKSSDTGAEQEWAYHNDDTRELENLDLYYKIFNMNRPEPGESNSEAAARHQAINDEYEHLLEMQRWDKQDKAKPTKHELTPSLPLGSSVHFRSLASYSSPITRYATPIIEPMEELPIPEPIHPTTNNVQEVSIHTDYSLYQNPDKLSQPRPIDIIYDTGAAISMMPAECHYAWTNLRECLHVLTGCFSGQTESNLQIGEFHGIITLDSGETRRAIIPECIQIPPGMSNTYLLADTAFLMAGHKYTSHLSAPKLKFAGGGIYTMSVTRGHKIIKILPTNATQETPHRIIYFHRDEPYDPPTFVNNVFFQCANRPNAQTPSTFTWHLRYACKCEAVLKLTQSHVDGLQIQQGTLHDLSKLLPCSACLAGKMRKTNKQPTKNYTEISNLLTNSPLSWTPSTADKFVNPNHTVSVDWGIINKRNKAGSLNVFALFLDVNTGLVFVYPAESRGQASEALKTYIQRYGKPHELIHDNAKEFVEGEFADICKEQGIHQTRSPPYEPNKNPVT